MDMLKLLEPFQEEENPDLTDGYIDDDHITTLSKDDIIGKHHP